MTSSTSSFEARLLALERSNRRLKVAVATLGACALLAVAGWQTVPEPPFDLLRVRRLQVVRKDGTTVIDLRADSPNDGGSMLMNDRYGVPKIEMAAHHRGAWFQLGETTDVAAEANFVNIYASSFGSTLTAHDATGAEATVNAWRKGASIESVDWRRNSVEWPSRTPSSPHKRKR